MTEKKSKGTLPDGNDQTRASRLWASEIPVNMSCGEFSHFEPQCEGSPNFNDHQQRPNESFQVAALCLRDSCKQRSVVSSWRLETKKRDLCIALLGAHFNDERSCMRKAEQRNRRAQSTVRETNKQAKAESVVYVGFEKNLHKQRTSASPQTNRKYA